MTASVSCRIFELITKVKQIYSYKCSGVYSKRTSDLKDYRHQREETVSIDFGLSVHPSVM